MGRAIETALVTLCRYLLSERPGSIPCVRSTRRPHGSVTIKTIAPTMDLSRMVACHECDLLHERKAIAFGTAAKCLRCGGLLYRRPRDSINRTLALSFVAAILFVVASTYPFMYFMLQGRVEINTILTGAVRLAERGDWPVGLVVLMVSIVIPGVKILSSLYVLLPLKLGRVSAKASWVFRLQSAISQWAMLEVYMLGTLIAIVNLLAMARIVLGPGFYSFVALMIVTTAASASLDREAVWAKLGVKR